MKRDRKIKKLPSSFKQYFWEIDFEKLDLEKRRIYILKRILEYGDKRAIVWMWKNFDDSEIKNVLYYCRDISLKSANFWALMLNIRKEKVKCLNKSFRDTQKQFWPY